MNEEPACPCLIYDGDCGFCRIWIDYWQRLTDDRVAYQPFQTAADQIPHIPSGNLSTKVEFNRRMVA